MEGNGYDYKRSTWGILWWWIQESTQVINTHIYIHTYTWIQIVVAQSLSHVWLFETPRTAACLASLSFTIFWSLLTLVSIESVMPPNYLIFCCPLLLPSIFLSIRVFSNESIFASGGQSIGVSALASVLAMNTQDWSPLEWSGWISLQSRDSQEFSPTPQFESINSSALSLLNGPILISIHDYWKNNSFD